MIALHNGRFIIAFLDKVLRASLVRKVSKYDYSLMVGVGYLF